MMRSSLVSLCCASILVLPAQVAAADREGDRAELERHRAEWSALGLRGYRFRLAVQCFCPEARHAVTVTVHHGRARGATGFQRRFDTVPEMFRRIAAALADSNSGPVKVSYDSRGRGFPRSVSIDPIKNAIDDELGWRVDRFRALD